MKVHSASERAKASRKLVFELLTTDQPDRAAAHEPDSRFWLWADRVDVTDSRFPQHNPSAADRSHPAMAVQLDACIHCTLCVRACREVQVNDVIGMAGRGHAENIVFDFADPMGHSTCVACGECVQACPTGALMPASLVDENGVYTNAPGPPGRERLPVLRRRLPADLSDQGRPHRRGRGQGRAGQPQPALRQGPLRLRLRPSPGPADRAADPQGRRAEARCRDRPGQPVHAFPHRDLGGGARPRRRRPQAHPRPRRRQRAGRVRLGQGVERRGLSVPEAGAHRVRHEQCRSLHKAVPRLVGRGADGGDRLGRGHRAVHRRRRRRGHHRDRRATDRKPPGRRDLLQTGREARRQAVRDGPAQPVHGALRDEDAAIQARPRRRDAERADCTRSSRRGCTTGNTCRRIPRISRSCASMCAITRRRRWPRSAASTPRPCARWRAAYARARAAIIFWGMGISQHIARHRQRALPDRAGAGHRAGRPPRHRAAPAARPEQRPGRLRRRPHPDGLSRLPVGRGPGRARQIRGRCGRPASTRSAA